MSETLRERAFHCRGSARFVVTGLSIGTQEVGETIFAKYGETDADRGPPGIAFAEASPEYRALRARRRGHDYI